MRTMRGSITVAMAGVVAICMLITLTFLSVAMIYAAHQATDTAATAAAIAALQALQKGAIADAQNEQGVDTVQLQFLTPAQRGCIVYRAAQRHHADINAAARRFAQRNGGYLEEPAHVIIDRSAYISLRVKRPIYPFIFDRMLPAQYHYLSLPLSLRIDRLAGEPLAFVGPC